MRGPRRQNFDEWSETWKPGDIRIPRSRFLGVTGLARELGIQIPEDNILGIRGRLGFVADDIGDAYGNASAWNREGKFPISNLVVQHHINRNNARDIFSSIKRSGFDINNPISIISDDDNYGVIMNGHHRAIAARAAGMTHIPALSVSFRDVESELPKD